MLEKENSDDANRGSFVFFSFRLKPKCKERYLWVHIWEGFHLALGRRDTY